MKTLITIGIGWLVLTIIYVGLLIHWYQPGCENLYDEPVQFCIGIRVFPLFMILMSVTAIMVTRISKR